MKPPKKLSGEALEFWKRNAPLCEQMGTLTDADADTFAILCEVWKKLADTDEMDTIRYVCLTKQFSNYSKLFGLDPVSRKKLGVSLDPTIEDEFGL